MIDLAAAQWAGVAIFVLLVCGGMVSDLRALLIPNWLSLALGGLFLPVALAGGMEWSGIGFQYAVGFGFLVAGLLFFSLNLIGGGDVKFAAAIAVWLGWPQAMGFLLLTALLGGVLAGFVLLMRMVPRVPSPVAALPWLAGRPGEAGMPYGIAIGLAGLVLLWRLVPDGWIAG